MEGVGDGGDGPWSTALEERRPAIELQNAWRESRSGCQLAADMVGTLRLTNIWYLGRMLTLRVY